jgi:anti-sigma28 factor (negative regulator of flagellin synthesis)
MSYPSPPASTRRESQDGLDAHRSHGRRCSRTLHVALAQPDRTPSFNSVVGMAGQERALAAPVGRPDGKGFHEASTIESLFPRRCGGGHEAMPAKGGMGGIAMTGLSSIGAAVRMNSVSPAKPVSAPASSCLAEPEDRVEISEAARRRTAIDPHAAVRMEKVSAVRDAIVHGTYETPYKIDVTVSRLLRGLRAGA